MKTENTQLKPAGPHMASISARLFIRSNTYRAAVVALLFAGATLLGTSAASADTITVINTNDSGPGSLRQALVDANNGDMINFDSSLNGQRITLISGELIVDKDVTISGPGAKNLAVDGNAQSRVFDVNPGKTVTIDGLTVANGRANFFGSGGGIYNDSAALTVTNCTFSGNSATNGGGGIGNSLGGATLTVSNCTFSSNSAVHGGGAIGNLGTLTVTSCTISSNSASFGGGIANRAYDQEAATATLSNCTISGNSASFGGGGVGNITDSGGSGTLTIANCTISGNLGSNGGGGISNLVQNASMATLTTTNSTISGNSASNGGGIYNEAFSANGEATLTTTNSTISGNSANSLGGGISNFGIAARLELGSTIFNVGSSGGNIYNSAGTITSHGYNLSSDNGGGYLIGLGDQINTDPVLGPLQDNGGPTFTHALLPGSPAIDTGDPKFTSPPFYDQRGPGFDRVVNGRIDVGSFEIQSAPTPTPTPTVTPTPTATPTPTPVPRHSPTPRPRPTPAPRP